MNTSALPGEHGDPAYVMGREAEETERLVRVATVLEPFTRRMLVDAGLTEGMRVLDVGSGPGDVALIAASVVGPSGSVVGLDQNPAVIERASARARAAGLDWVSFVGGDVRKALPAGGFDAVVGRLVLMYMADPVAVVRQLAEQLTGDGIVAFQDFNFTTESCRIYPPVRLWQQAWGWVVDTITEAGITPEMGFALRGIFLGAGLPEPVMRLESYVGAGAGPVASDWMADSVRSMLPLIAQFGVASPDEVGIDHLADRLRQQARAVDAVVKAPDLVSAWTRLP